MTAPASAPAPSWRARALVARALGAAAAAFYDVDRIGPPLPPGPVLVVANHPNVFLDAFVVFRTAGRPARPLAKASHFNHPVYGPFLRAMGGLPVHRRQDDPSRMGQNEETFRAATDALAAGDALQIYPEGRSHSEPAVAPLRTGAARIALRAEAEAGWRLGLVVVPVGLTYARKTVFRGHAVAAFGPPLPIAPWRAASEADPARAVRELTGAIAAALEGLTLNLVEAHDGDLIEIAARLYARQRGELGWRARERLGPRLPRLQAFARGLAWLRAHDPPRHRRLARAVRRYGQVLARLGAGEGEVPPRTAWGPVLRYVLREGLLLGLGLPFALLGALVWGPAYLAPRALVRLTRPASQAVATWKLLAGLAAFPLAWVLWVGAFVWALGLGWALAAALLLPALGLAAFAWGVRWERVREDLRLFARVRAHRGTRERLGALRAALAAEFDAVAAGMEAARTGSGSAGSP